MLNARRSTYVVGTAALVTMALAACSGGTSGGTSTSAGGTTTTAAALTSIAVWDPYPQYDDSSAWAAYVKACAPAGTTITRTTAATSDLLNNLTSAVKEDNAPDVVMLDNDRKAAMVSNLLVVLCGDRNTEPVVNTGTIYQ